jgi:hypothetical protein
MSEGPINGNIPGWVKILATFGFPIFVALWFMGVFEAFLPSGMGLHYRIVEAHIKDMAEMRTASRDDTKLLRLICRNTARDDGQRIKCDE